MDYKPLPDEKPFLSCLAGAPKYPKDKVNCISPEGGNKSINFTIRGEKGRDIAILNRMAGCWR